MKTQSQSNSDYQEKVASAANLRDLLDFSRGTTSRGLGGSGMSDEDKLFVLKELLGYAVILEFATIPIYLSAMWTIKDNNCEVAKSIREIFQEEMLHMSMVCNMLVGIGGEPKIYSSDQRLSFPTGLPGDVHPELFLHLEGLSDCSLRNFMEIELPDKIAEIYDYETKKRVGLTKLCSTEDHDPREESLEQDHAHNSTIGELYDRINELFHELNPKLDVERQLSGPLAWFVMEDATSVAKAIDIIKEQGEGSENATPEDTGMDDLAHFYRFWEVYQEKKIVEENGKYYFKDPFPRPEIHEIARIPEGGYLEKDVTPGVWHLLHEFDKAYSKLVWLLEDAWAIGGGGQASLVKAIEYMFRLERYALPLVQTPIPEKKGLNYGPCFRIIDIDMEK